MIDNDKRTKLIDAAKALFYAQGYHRTTIAQIAAGAEVPLGNVYYYFKTKDAIGAEVVASHVAELRSAFKQLEHEPDPRQRLIKFVHSSEQFADQLAQLGCPYGSLAQELDKGDEHPLVDPAAMLRTYLSWTEQQFRLAGCEDAGDLAIDLISALQGTFLLTNGLKSPELLSRKIRRLTRWLEEVA